MLRPVRFETMSEIKSVPAVEAPALSATAMEKPYRKPPKTTWSIRSATSGRVPVKKCKKNDESATCRSENTTKRRLMLRQQIRATGC